MTHTITELLTALDAANTGAPESSVETAIAVYLAAKSEIDAYDKVADAAKKLIGDVMTETAQTAYSTKAGKVAITAPSVSVTYDAKALDALAASSDVYARLLAPHRKQTERAGTMRITAAK